MHAEDLDRLEVVDDSEARRWQARLDGEVLGFAEYRRSPTRIVFTHTVVRPEYEGRGIAARLARAALGDAARRGLRVLPACPYFRSYLRRHHDYDDLIDVPRDSAPDSAGNQNTTR